MVNIAYKLRSQFERQLEGKLRKQLLHQPSIELRRQLHATLYIQIINSRV